MEDVPNLDVDGLGTGWTDQEEEALVRSGPETQRRRHQREGGTRAFLLGEIREHLHDHAMGGIEPAIDVRVAAGPEDDVGVVRHGTGNSDMLDGQKS